MTTPRPWHTQPNDEGKGIVIADESNYWVAITQNDGQDNAEERANAALIVRAVNTFDEAKAVLDDMCCYLEAGAIKTAKERHYCISKIKPILAKMEGR